MTYSNAFVFMRPVERKDLPLIRRLRNDASTWGELTDPLPLTEADEDAWYLKLSCRGDRLYFVAFDEKHPFIGLIRMDARDLQNRSIRVGLDVLPELREQGHGQHIYQMILSYCFDELNVHRIWLCVLATNDRAIHVYKDAGFRVEGSMREAVFRHGRYVNYVVMSILEGERP